MLRLHGGRRLGVIRGRGLPDVVPGARGGGWGGFGAVDSGGSERGAGEAVAPGKGAEGAGPLIGAGAGCL